ncbi:hypothetical protein CEXT_380691 [Caerostris extrusa]|uniref:Uncharacterized protein n=1 Tax=Caerostris extrusa TaxID=172846 RepID=A0AAV4TQT7_CAEEX|nr:hypothetical protein CEXT_380691 [Caerostris extrusa]
MDCLSAGCGGRKEVPVTTSPTPTVGFSGWRSAENWRGAVESNRFIRDVFQFALISSFRRSLLSYFKVQHSELRKSSSGDEGEFGIVKGFELTDNESCERILSKHCIVAMVIYKHISQTDSTTCVARIGEQCDSQDFQGLLQCQLPSGNEALHCPLFYRFWDPKETGLPCPSLTKTRTFRLCVASGAKLFELGNAEPIACLPLIQGLPRVIFHYMQIILNLIRTI